MLLTISTTHTPATDLGYLLHKNPARPQEFSLSFGRAHIFYPEASHERCTAALLLDIDPVSLVRGSRHGGGDGPLQQYVNDRPYVASSFLSVAISRVFGTALGGRSKDRPELVERDLPLSASVTALPCRGGEALVRRLFEPLGYEVRFENARSRYCDLHISSTTRLASLLAHLYVLIPVLDDDKHYWVGSEEVDKLLRHGEGWLRSHPEREQIAERYLKHRRGLAREALLRLSESDESDPEATEQDRADGESALERPIRLNDVRVEAVARVLTESGATRVLDLGCGEGSLLGALLSSPQFHEIAGLDASVRALEIAARRLKLEEIPARRKRVQLMHGALTYRDARLAGYDAAAVVEVIEHLDLPRLAAFERAIFAFAKPGVVVVTTPNREFNANFAGLAAGAFRHKDHRFEWTRAEFAEWAQRVAASHAYEVQFQSVGEVDPTRGAPTQMGIFRRCA